jgi:hypothetical protein
MWRKDGGVAPKRRRLRRSTFTRRGWENPAGSIQVGAAMRLAGWLVFVGLGQFLLAVVLLLEHGWAMVGAVALLGAILWWFERRPSVVAGHLVRIADGHLAATTPQGRKESLALADVDEVVVENRSDGSGNREIWWIVSGAVPLRRCEIPLGATGFDEFDAWLDTLEGADEGAYPAKDATQPSHAIFWKRSSDWKAPQRPARTPPTPSSTRVVDRWRTKKLAALIVFIGTYGSVFLLGALGIPKGQTLLVCAIASLLFWASLAWLALRRSFPGTGWTVTIAEETLRVTDADGHTRGTALVGIREVTIEQRPSLVHGLYSVFVVEGETRLEIPSGAGNELDFLDWLLAQPGFGKAAERAAIDSMIGIPTPAQVLWTRS